MAQSESARAVLDAAVASIGGQPRAGQIEMADAVWQAIEDGSHLLVQAGTGTGKSFGYLAPVLVWAKQGGERAVVATATLALQSQLANKDIPVAIDAVNQVLGVRPTMAVVKGRSNYACLLRVRDGVGLDQEPLFDVGKGATAVGAEVVALREWVAAEVRRGGLADRDDAPRHTARSWSQVAVGSRECIGSKKCPYAEECFVEESRRRAHEADLIVTNHSLLAVDAMQNHSVLPDHAVVVIDEAHELVDRVTTTFSQELSPAMVARVAQRAKSYVEEDIDKAMQEAIDAFDDGLQRGEIGRITTDDAPVLDSLLQVAAAAHDEIDGLNNNVDLEAVQTQSELQEVFEIADRLAAHTPADVVWVSDRERYGRQMVVAPLNVVNILRDRIFQDAACLLTSATLTVGGNFEPLASRMGFEANNADSDDEAVRPWRGLDVGSPFDYRTQGICYVATGLPKPSRDGIGMDQLDQIVTLVRAAGGRTLGLFSSQRSAETAAAHVRREAPELTVLCQGDAQLPDLTRQFIDEPATCLFGTLSLWQGVDVPGETCLLVLIDKIPFARPDDPLTQARQDAVVAAGGNGFMKVSVTQAGLLLAQGAGRLIRKVTDQGVVAILDPRLVTARYGSFLRASLPDFWQTTNLSVAVDALKRLASKVSLPESIDQSK